MGAQPKISIVTSVYNQVGFIEATIQSVLEQSYPNLEYIVVDALSTDGTSAIIDKYSASIDVIIREKDNGLYDALNKGFEKSTGDIMCYLNGDDVLYPGSLDVVAEILSLNQVNWVTGIPSSIDENGRIIGVGSLNKWSKYKFFSGNYKWIQQESTFWSRELWELAGGHINDKYSLAGDFELWSRFFLHEELYSVDTILGGFRLRSKNQLSLEGIDKYENETQEICSELFKSLSEADKLWIEKLKRGISKKTKIPGLGRFSFKTNQEWYKYPPLIRFNRAKQKFYIHHE